jgi:hypothetical protein
VLPYWTAGEAPCQVVPGEAYQVGIWMEGDRRVGTTWVTTTISPSMRMVRSVTQLNLAAIRTVLPLAGDLFLHSNLSYEPDDTLDSFDFTVRGLTVAAKVEGERYGRDYACTIHVGERKWTIGLEGKHSAYLGETLRPFTRLKNLAVGQKWRMRVLDPFAVLQSQSLEFSTKIAKVTARETIVHDGGRVPCFRIETEGTVAWADSHGRVLRQEVNVPLLGRFILTDEPFDREAWKKAGGPVKVQDPRRERAGSAPADDGE